MPDLVVIMSIYKNDKLEFVTESVQSILQQTYTDFDYYIVFDGPVSSDIDNYFSSIYDKRIKLFKRDKNEGLAVALNYLLALILSNQEYKIIARMDADDISNNTRFEKQRKFLSENPEISVVGSWYEEMNINGAHISFIRLPVSHEDLKNQYFFRTPFAHPSVMYRRELIEKAGYYPTDTVFMEDNALWGNALKESLLFANIPEYLLLFRRDVDFLKRRSGIYYGLKYIKKRFAIFRSLKLPVYKYIIMVMIGIVKMMPVFVLRYIYIAARKI